ncbi:putative fatty acyl-CoA reductase CG5065 [Sitophilus oryzae]|uniref:Fatty acyl-CoA reductase n=1 Tax=Sitophilus oryzae TaxID=7048 RepID=A0A6J2YFP8_SITOR|nr:putative fatty acyl-CoA reductase CG5065 [Sitophilus oryzae]
MDKIKNGPISAYYKDKNIFITGGTGFIGKALIEKLLRSCPGVGNIYILLRSKKGMNLEERCQKLFSNPIFDNLKNSNSDVFYKVIPVRGNVAEANLGLSSSDRQILIEKVNVIFHAAASVRFDDFIKDAILTNLRSARDMALLSLEMKNIEVFVHVSTAYCSITENKTVPEKLLPARGNWKKAIYLAENGEENILNTFSHKFIGDFPNTYTYTKHLAEHCINDLLTSKIPTVIVRPTIVVAAINEPLRGWIDNWNGINGLCVGAGFGVFRIGLGDPNIGSDCTPVDNVVKVLILSAWNRAQRKSLGTVEIMQSSAYNQKKYSIKHFTKIAMDAGYEVPLDVKMWYPNITFTQCWTYYYINAILIHFMPAVLLDLFLKLFGHKPFLFKIQRKVFVSNIALNYFMTHDWDFLNDNAMKLFNDDMLGSEKEEFKFHMVKNDKETYDYIKDSFRTTRWVLLNMSKEIKPRTMALNKGLYYLDKLCKGLFYLAVIWFLFFKLNIITICWESTLKYWKKL